MLGTFLSIFLSIFTPPVDYEISLAGNFGEPRPNHFHGGLDIRTDGVEGKHIYAIGDGYVSRITMGKNGFGNAVYITHPSGQTSIYCHLRSFSPRIKAALRKWQYKHEISDADARLSPRDCPVVQGQFIALSGNTGASTAPHLHLEIHDTRSWHLLDPYDFLTSYISDTVPPTIHGIMAYPVEGMVNGDYVKRALGAYPDTIHAWGTIGFGIWANDYMQGSSNFYGIRETILLVDGEEVFHSNVTDIPVECHMMVNSWGDYDHWTHNKVWYMKSFVEPGNSLPIFSTNAHRGLVSIDEERFYHFEYVLRDVKGNEVRRPFVVKGVKRNVQKSAPSHAGTLLRWNRLSSYAVPGLQLVVPYGSLPHDVVLHPMLHKDSDAVSPTYTLSPSSLPLFRYVNLSIHPLQDVQDPTKLYVTGNNRYFGGEYKDGWVTGRIRELGYAYRLAYDDEPPHVKPVTTDGPRIVISATDAQSGVASWKATVDGRFVVFDAIEKTSSYVCNLRETPVRPNGKLHKLVFTATDRRNNTQTFETTIRY